MPRKRRKTGPCAQRLNSSFQPAVFPMCVPIFPYWQYQFMPFCPWSPPQIVPSIVAGNESIAEAVHEPGHAVSMQMDLPINSNNSSELESNPRNETDYEFVSAADNSGDERDNDLIADNLHENFDDEEEEENPLHETVTNPADTNVEENESPDDEAVSSPGGSAREEENPVYEIVIDSDESEEETPDLGHSTNSDTDSDDAPVLYKQKCSICLAKLKKPVKCSRCTNVSCWICWDEWLKFRGECPICKLEIDMLVEPA